MKEIIKESWFRAMVIFILVVVVIIYNQDRLAQIQLKEEKEANRYRIEQAELKLKIEKEDRIKREKLDAGWAEVERKRNLEDCLDSAYDAYWSWIENNGTYNEKDETYWATDYHWDMAEKRKKSIEDKCFKTYK